MRKLTYSRGVPQVPHFRLVP